MINIQRGFVGEINTHELYIWDQKLAETFPGDEAFKRSKVSTQVGS